MNLPFSHLFLVGFIFKLQSSKLRNTGSVLGVVGKYKDKASSFVECHSVTLWVTLWCCGSAVPIPKGFPGILNVLCSASDVCKHDSTGHPILCQNAGHVCFC